ncbi:unnamed protein product [Closterium sp. NIES-53]
MYLMTCTRPDLAYPLSLLACYMAPGRHRKVHWDAAKRVLRYLCSTSGMGLVLGGRARVVLKVDDLATQRSSQGYTFSLGSALRWLTYLLTDLGEAPRSPPVPYVDNKAMLALCQEHRLEHRTKHIALRYFLARELQQRGQLRLAYMASQANTADVFTKALQPCDHQLAARDVIFYERLTLPTYLANLEEDRDPTGGFRGDRHFASAADEADWDEQNVDNASEEAGPLPYCSVPIPMDDENPCESVNAETYFDLADTGYITSAEVNTNEAERIGPNFIPDPETGDEAAYPADTTLPRYTQSGLQILGLVTAVHGTETPKEPATVQQALGGEHREKWHEAMEKELKALQERNTWNVVPIGVARNKTILTGKWVFRVKTKADGTIDKFKARWVVRGFDQEHGRDFTETFAQVGRHTSLRILLAIAAMKKKKLRQIDVANAFLYAPVDAEIFVELPHDCGSSTYTLDSLASDSGSYRTSKECTGSRKAKTTFYIGSTDNITTWFEGELQRDLTLTFSPTVTQYLGLNIQEGENAIYLNAAKYADTIAKRFSLTPTTISTPYRYTAGNDKAESAPLKLAGIRDYQRKLGCLLFAAVTCRPDLSYSASQLATYLKRPEAEHMTELDRALHYLVSTPKIGLIYYKNRTTTPKLIGYVDADHAGDPDNMHSRTGYVYRLEPIGPISWQSSKQELIALSSAEAEYIALCSATKEGLYLREFLEEAKLAQLPSFSLFCDNQSAICIANKNGFANRTKHIALRYFFVKDEIEKGRRAILLPHIRDGS